MSRLDMPKGTKLRCPNDPINHDTFDQNVVIRETWLVTKDGSYCGTHKAGKKDLGLSEAPVCATCGTPAEVVSPEPPVPGVIVAYTTTTRLDSLEPESFTGEIGLWDTEDGARDNAEAGGHQLLRLTLHVEKVELI